MKNENNVYVIMIRTLQHELSLLVKLGRLKMTIFSAVTYSTAYTLAFHHDLTTTQRNSIDIPQFLLGWLFVLFCQLSAHFLGEYFDYNADCSNKQDSPFTGGSRVLVKEGYSPTRCMIFGWTSAILSLITLRLFLPHRIQWLGYPKRKLNI